MTDDSATKKFPDCAEEVRAAALKCRFCGFMFPESSGDVPSPELPDAEPVLAVEEATQQLRRPKQAPRRLGRTQARVILGLFVVLVIGIGYFYFEYMLALTIAAILIYGAWLAEEGRSKTRAAQDARIVCAHCHSTGCVTTSNVKLKKGISGGKATGAILTGGLSLLAVGLSRKEDVTEAKCSNCGSVWHF